MMIVGVPVEHLERCWPLLEHHIQRAIDRSGMNDLLTAGDLIDDLRAGNLQAWGIIDAQGEAIGAAITRITVYPRARVLSIDYLGAESDGAWMDEAMRQFRQFAREHGCEYVRGYGRPGWLRRLRRDGLRALSFFDLPA